MKPILQDVVLCWIDENWGGSLTYREMKWVLVTTPFNWSAAKWKLPIGLSSIVLS